LTPRMRQSGSCESFIKTLEREEIYATNYPDLNHDINQKDLNSSKIQTSLASTMSNLRLDLSYYRDKGAIVWDVSRFYLNQNRFKANGVTIIRNIRPTEDLGENLLDNWKRLMQESKPNDMKVYPYNDNTAIAKV